MTIKKNTFDIKIYDKLHKHEWDNFVDNSIKNFFIFKRDFIEYKNGVHDYSIKIYKNKKLIALIPCSFSGDKLLSHQNITYGGIITNRKINIDDFENIISSLLSFIKKKGFKKFIYKIFPDELINSLSGLEEYFLLKSGFSLDECYLNTIVDLKQKFIFSKNVNRYLKKNDNIITIKNEKKIDKFYNILSDHLKFKYKTNPTHTFSELKYLMKVFPNNVQCLCCYLDDQNLGGYLIFHYNNNIAHMQYSAFTDSGRKNYAQDYLTDFILKKKIEFFSFGKSDDPFTKYINKNLINKKLKYGSKPICEKIYFKNL